MHFDTYSDSSDSESLFEEDKNGDGSQINQQWEAIERTLYQENGEQVTDPELLKECKLWRETFPHFRVRGTKIDVKKPDEDDEESDKGIQTLNNHFNLSKINEKRESIKSKVVGELVERLITKFNLNKNSSSSTQEIHRKGVDITEIDDTTEAFMPEELCASENDNKALISSNSNNSKGTETKLGLSSAGKESYFERGKFPVKENFDQGNTALAEEKPDQLDQSVEMWNFVEFKKIKKLDNLKKPKKTEKESSNVNAKKPELAKIDDFSLNYSDKPTRVKPKKTSPPSESVSSFVKPFEMTKKIDKKYESLVEKLLERKQKELEPIMRNYRMGYGFDERGTYQKALEKARERSGFGGEENLIKNKNLPSINRFNNNWLDRGEMNFLELEEELELKNTKSMKSLNETSKLARNISAFREQLSQCDIDDKFIEDLKREMMSNCKRPPRKSGVIEDIKLRRPKVFFNPAEHSGRTQKSSSCGDLPKKNKKNTRSRPLKNGLENVTNEGKNRAKSLNSNAKTKKCSLLPPIESGIICTELKGLPIAGSRYPPRKH